MNKNDKIHIKLEICKEENSNELKLMTHFDSNAPNFFKENDNFFWMPTMEEKDFINEAFDLMPSDGTTSPPKKTPPEPPTSEPPNPETPQVPDTVPPEKKEEQKIPPEPPTPKPPELPDTPPPDEKEEKPRIFHSPFGKKKEENTPEPPTKVETRDETVFEVTGDEVKPENKDVDKKEGDVFVKADDNAIEEALKKHEENDNSIVEADERTIIEKVLSQKKKGRWSKDL